MARTSESRGKNAVKAALGQRQVESCGHRVKKRKGQPSGGSMWDQKVRTREAALQKALRPMQQQNDMAEQKQKCAKAQE